MGLFKSRVYISEPQNLEAFKENVRQECENLSPKVLAGVMENLAAAIWSISRLVEINSNGLNKRISQAKPNVFIKRKILEKNIG